MTGRTGDASLSAAMNEATPSKMMPRTLAAPWAAFLALVLMSMVAGTPLAAEPAVPGKATVTIDDLEALAATIENDAGRRELVARIRALIAVQKGDDDIIPIDSVGAKLIDLLSTGVHETGRYFSAVAGALRDLPVFADWVFDQMTDAELSARWLAVIAKLSVILAVGWLAEWLVRRLVRHPLAALNGRPPGSLVLRSMLLLLSIMLHLLPLLAFAGAAYGTITVTQPVAQARVVAITFVNAYLIARGLLVIVRQLLIPGSPSCRVWPISDETATYLFIWARRLIPVAVSGYFLAEAALLFGLPPRGHAGFLRVLGAFIAFMLTVFILQNRRAVADWIRNADETGLGWLGAWRLRRRIADIWHVLALIYIAAIYVVWAVGIPGGFRFIITATALSIAIIVGARLIVAGLERALRSGFAIGDELKSRYPTLEIQANRYLSVIQTAFRLAVWAGAVLALLQTWGVDSFALLTSPAGKKITSSGITIALVMLLALVFWEVVVAAIERYLHAIDDTGTVRQRSARVRTLLPLLRNVVFVVLTVMVALIVLSELGVNIAPLLAGAGVVGLAVGFGAQKLVQDVITGAFILFEDSVSVGDQVEVGGHTGTVEALNIRSIRLRDAAGSVHTIPFSSVTAVTNMNKGFSNAMFDIGIAYRENTDEVCGILREIGKELQADPSFGSLILSPIEVLGVDRFADSAVMIKAQFKTLPLKNANIAREFNRRLKMRFDERGIEMPFPHRTVFFGQGKDGEAPPIRIAEAGTGGEEKRPPTDRDKDAGKP